MTDRAISFTVDLARAVLAGRITQTRRPGTLLQRCRPGDRLWVREPFRLEPRYDHLAPLQATIGSPSRVWFAADSPPGAAPEGAGRRRFARELPRVFHRAHLIVTAARIERVQDAAEADAAAEGVPDLASYPEHWDQLYSPGTYTLSGERGRWADNPRVAVLTFDLVGRPL